MLLGEVSIVGVELLGGRSSTRDNPMSLTVCALFNVMPWYEVIGLLRAEAAASTCSRLVCAGAAVTIARAPAPVPARACLCTFRPCS